MAVILRNLNTSLDIDKYFIFLGQLFAFYSIFYIALAALFAICMQTLMSTINNDEPKWKLTESLIGINPGLGIYL